MAAPLWFCHLENEYRAALSCKGIIEINPVMFLKCLGTSAMNTKERLRNRLKVLYSGRISLLGCERRRIFTMQLKGRIEMLLMGSADCHVH